MAAKFVVPFDDLMQEARLRIIEKCNASSGHDRMKWQGIYAMRDLVRREMNEKHARTEAAKGWRLMKRTVRTFHQMESCLRALEPDEERVMRLWLDGGSNTKIGKQVGIAHTTVKRMVERAAGKMAKCLGRDLNVESLWPALNRGLPTGVRLKDGRFYAYAGRGGKHLGCFDSVDDAAAARRVYAQ